MLTGRLKVFVEHRVVAETKSLQKLRCSIAFHRFLKGYSENLIKLTENLI